MVPQSVVTPSPRRSARSRWLVAALLVGTALAACKKEDTGKTPSSTPSSGTSSSSSGQSQSQGQSQGQGQGSQQTEAAITPESLAPVIKELGPEGVVPDKVIFEFSRSVNYPDGEGKKGTVIHFSPDVGGNVEFYRNNSALSFTPANGFELGTNYTVTLESVDTQAGVVKAPSEGAWRYSFTTPKLRFIDMAPSQVDTVKGEVTAELVFSGPVDPGTLRRFATFQVDGKSLDAKLTSHPSQHHVVVAQFSSSQLRPGVTVRMALKGGLTSPKGGGTAPAAEGSFALQGGKRMDITNVAVSEGNSGFYMDVSCRDVEMNAKPSPDEGEWDPYYYDRNNLGCVLDENVAADAIHFTPAVKFTISPSRRGIRIFGDFKRGTYTLKIDAGTLSQGGGRLLSTFQNRYSISARKPQVNFTSAGRYLPRSAWRNLPLNHLNVDTVDLTIRQVPPENLVFWMSDDSKEAADERTSNVLVTKKISLKNPEDALTTTYLDVGSMVPSTTRGVVEVSVKRDETQAAARILLTDLSLVAKRGGTGDAGQEEVLVWALGMESTEPLSGVEVSLVKKSGQAVARCTTNGADGCKIQVPAPGVDTAPPFALIARKGDDLTYLKYSELKTEIANSDVQGEPYRAQAAYRASIYSDRGVYRPGDTAHVTAVLRDQEDKAPPAAMPVELRVVDPREREFKKVALKTNEAGLVALDLPFEAFQDTGSYRVTLRVADRDVATYSLQVEEFVPERMKVTAEVDKEGYQQGSVVPVKVEAAYLFGGSAEGSPVELNCRLEPSEFKPKENAQFTYGVWRQKATEAKAVTLGQVKGEVNAKGQALVECPAKETAGGFKGPAKLVAQASVFEAGSGRSTVGDVTVPMHPEAYYVGLQSNVQKVESGKPFTVTGVVVDWEGKLITDNKALKALELETYRLDEEYGYYYDEDEGYERFQRYQRPVREGRVPVKVEGGKFQITVTPAEDSAGFIVRARSGNAQTDLQLEGNGRYYWYGDGEARVDQTPRPLKPASVALELPKMGKLNQPIAVKFKAPYRGRVLLTAETDRVIASEWKQVEPGEVSWSFTPKSFAPNVYVAAFLVKDPHLESAEAFMPDRAFGVGNVTLEPTDFTQTVKLDVPKEVRSNSTLTVNLELGPQEGPTFATVAVVDEGILSLTRFKSPDPLKELFAKRALGVETYETIGWTLLVPPGGNSRSTGGDEAGAGGRVQPVKPVALWSGVVPVPANGKLSLPFKLPMYRGALRVMAVTTGPKRVGHVDAQVLVRDPLVLQTTLPRFLTQGDEIQIPVFLTNLSGGPQEVKVSLTAESLPVPGLTLPPAALFNPVQMLGKSEGRTKLENGKSATLVFQAKAIMAVGAARLKVTAEGGGFTAFEQLDVPLQPAGSRERVVQRILLNEGKVDLAQYLQGWVPTTESSTFWVTTNPYAESLQHLSYLIHYPYGCIEQTTSSTRPLLFVSQLIDNVDPTLTANKKVEDMVMAGVNRALSMQTPSGGFAYWPGGTEPVAWGTAYATHMLLDAQKLKYPVPQDRLDDAVAWLGQELNRKEGTVNQGNHYGQSEAYMHYVLALAGKARKARVQKLIDELATQKTTAGEAREDEYMLKAALYLAGDRRYEKDLKNPDLSAVTEERQNSWTFYSDRRRRGMMLSTFQDLFGNAPEGEPLAEMVAQSLIGHSSSYYNTQELVWGITGLGKRISGAASNFTPPVLTADGKEVAPQANDGGKTTRASDLTWALARASERKGLSLDLKSKSEGKLYLILNSEGVRSTSTAKTGGQGLAISRTYRKLDGSEINPGDSVNLADLIYVEVEIKNTTGERIQNIAMVDRLPAGWEIENARLGRGGTVEWVNAEEQWAPDYVNIRDDRMEVFGSLQARESKKVVYAVRAVTAGKFTLPSIEAEAMYDPRIWAREAGQSIEVAGPWKDYLL